MINFDDYTNEKTQHNKKWPYIPDYPYRILIIGGSRSGKENALLNLINNQPDIDKIYLYAKDSYEVKYQFLIDNRKSIGLKYFDYPRAFIEYSYDMQVVYKNIDEYNIDKERKISIVFDDMFADVINNKKLNSILTEKPKPKEQKNKQKQSKVNLVVNQKLRICLTISLKKEWP